MKLLRILALCWIIGLALCPAALSAGSTAVVTITAQPWGTGDCPVGFTFNAVSSYEVQLAWTPGGNSTGTVIRGAYARWPTDPTDGFEVYNGSGSSASHWLTTDVMILSDEGIYYRLWGKQGGNYSLCYASGVITGGTGMTVLGTGVTLIGTIILAFLALGCMVSGYHFKNSLFMWGATIFWVAVIGFSYAQSSVTGDTFYIIAGASGMMALLSVAFIVGGMGKDKPGLDETALQKYQKTESVKAENMDDFKKRMGLKGKRSLNRYPWEHQ